MLPPLSTFIIGTGISWASGFEIAIERDAVRCGGGMRGRRAIRRASRWRRGLDLFSVPSSAISLASSVAPARLASKPRSAAAIVRVDVGDRAGSRPCRQSVSGRRRAIPAPRGRRSKRPRARQRGPSRRRRAAHQLRWSDCRANRESRARLNFRDAGCGHWKSPRGKSPRAQKQSRKRGGAEGGAGGAKRRPRTLRNTRTHEVAARQRGPQSWGAAMRRRLTAAHRGAILALAALHARH